MWDFFHHLWIQARDRIIWPSRKTGVHVGIVLLVSLLTPAKIPQKKKETSFRITSFSHFTVHFDGWPIHSYNSIPGVTFYPRLPSALLQKWLSWFGGIFTTPVLSSESYHCETWTSLQNQTMLSKRPPSVLCCEPWRTTVEDVCFWPCICLGRGGEGSQLLLMQENSRG